MAIEIGTSNYCSIVIVSRELFEIHLTKLLVAGWETRLLFKLLTDWIWKPCHLAVYIIYRLHDPVYYIVHELSRPTERCAMCMKTKRLVEATVNGELAGNKLKVLSEQRVALEQRLESLRHQLVCSLLPLLWLLTYFSLTPSCLLL